MNRSFLVLAVLVVAILGASCGGIASNANAVPSVRKGAVPVADSEIAVIEMENPSAYGTIKIELYSNIAPKMVTRFKQLAREGVYNGVTFHRVNQSVVQTGNPNSKDGDPTNDGLGGSNEPNVPAEFSDVKYEAGIVGAARGNEFDSANSQFFITLRREQGFDDHFTVFGKVIAGMGNVRTIAGAPRNGERPIDEIRIRSIRIEPAKARK